MTSRTFRVTPDVSLEHELDVEERIARTPAQFTIKGMFLLRHMRPLGASYAELRPLLREPPEGDRYQPFADYPHVDHARLTVAVAARLFPTVSLAEAVRRIERHMAEVFVSSNLGRAVSALAASPAAALKLYPVAWRHSQSGGVVTAHEVGRGRVRVEVRRAAPWLDCGVLGSIEGTVVLFGKRPIVEVELLSDFDANYDVTWT